MNTNLQAGMNDLWLIAGWTMIHFLWLGTLVGVAAAFSRLILRRASASLRYTITLAWLLTLVALPFATATFLVSRDAQRSVPQSYSITSPTPALTTSSAPGSAGVRASATIANDPTSAEDLTPTEPQQSRGLSTIPTTQPTDASNFDTLANLVTSTIPYLPLFWLIGTPLTLALLLTGIVGARRLNRASHQISEGPIAVILARLTTSLHITRQVTVAICDRIAAPVLIGIIRPVILLPPSALTGWSPDELEMVLLHELAHVRRWDNLINLLQRLIESLLFFHPAVWIISTWVRRDRESCCDALVVGRTNRPHAYAEMLVALAAQMPRSVLFHPAASSAMAAGPLRYRIRRILQLEDDPMLVSGKSLTVALGSLLLTVALAVFYLPTAIQAEPATNSTGENAASKSDDGFAAPNDSTGDQRLLADFPHEVKFERGAHRFLEGDEITIAEVRGTAKTFEPGNRYWIRGSYKLHSHDRAKLCAFVTAKDAKPNDPATTYESDQVTILDRGDGNFTLILPIKTDGWPHVSLYPIKSGSDFGGIYFGTGDTVLQKWWDADDTAKTVASGENSSSLNITVASSDKETGTTLHAGETPQTNSPSAEIRSSSLTLVTTVDKDPSGKFPSLEEQKLADLAYQRLGLELEPISADDLKRVKALGYNGAVKVIGVSGSQMVHGAMGANDLLVGLHVWPTTSLKVIGQILSRGDLNELNPLKYYVIHRPAAEGVRDEVLSGRISIGGGGGRTNPFTDSVGQPALRPTKKQDDTSTRKFKTTTDATNNSPFQAPHGQQPELQSNPFAQGPASVASDRYNAPASAPATRGPGGMAPENAEDSASSTAAVDRTLVAYDVPAELQRNVEAYAKEADFKFVWDQKGRCIIQASAKRHKEFKSLLDSTMEWRKKNLTPEALEHPFVNDTNEGQPALRWRAAGLTLVLRRDPSLVIVQEVADGSPAAWIDIHPGDALHRIKDFNVSSLSEAESILSTLASGFNDDRNEIKAYFVRSPVTPPNQPFMWKSLPLKPVAETPTTAGGMSPATFGTP